MADVRREGGRVWIEDVPQAELGTDWDMLLRGMCLLLRHRGIECELDDLMVLSGDAFNLCFASEWHGTARLGVATDTLANIAAGYGFRWRWQFSGRESELENMPEEERSAVTRNALGGLWASVDAGRPFLAGGAADRGPAAWSVVVGYDRRRPAMCHVGAGRPYRWVPVRGLSSGGGVAGYWDGRVRGQVCPEFRGGVLANPAFVLEQRMGRPGRQARILDALERAPALFQAAAGSVSRWGGVTYHFGREAYQQWARGLRALDNPEYAPAEWSEATPERYDMGVMDFLLDCVIRGRNAAAQFCERSGELLPGAKFYLGAAARFYRRQVMLAEDAFGDFIEGTEPARAEWLSDEAAREAGADAVLGMLDHERAAVREIERALEVERSEVPAPSERTHQRRRARRMPLGPALENEEEKAPEGD